MNTSETKFTLTNKITTQSTGQRATTIYRGELNAGIGDSTLHTAKEVRHRPERCMLNTTNKPFIRCGDKSQAYPEPP